MAKTGIGIEKFTNGSLLEYSGRVYPDALSPVFEPSENRQHFKVITRFNVNFDKAGVKYALSFRSCLANEFGIFLYVKKFLSGCLRVEFTAEESNDLDRLKSLSIETDFIDLCARHRVEEFDFRYNGLNSRIVIS